MPMLGPIPLKGLPRMSHRMMYVTSHDPRILHEGNTKTLTSQGQISGLRAALWAISFNLIRPKICEKAHKIYQNPISALLGRLNGWAHA